MRPPCLVVVEDAVPEVRKALAKELYSKGSSQEAISSLLGVSQAMVSRYLKEPLSPRGSIDAFVAGIVRPLSAYAQQGAGPEEMTRMFCTLCRRLMTSGSLDSRYAERFPGSAPPRCMGSTFDERGEALADLSAAARYLGKAHMPGLVPAVKVNMARCLDLSSSRDDVASFPGRLQDVRGNIQQPLPPQFGASQHLADILLEAHAGDPSVLAVCNIRLSDEIGSVIGSMGIPSSVLGRDQSGRIIGVRDKVRDGCRALADPGHFGIEPCLYLFGRTSLELASLMVEIDGSLEGR